ncbi:MAG: methylated-DNA--[protein]-cysteine S-methyltransferase [Candidatus Kapaibacterium sp.]
MNCHLVIDSPLGNILIIGTESEISCVEFIGDTDAVSSENPPEIVRRCATELREYFEGTRREFSVPLRQHGTEFQQNVWQQLSSINYGNTISYLDLALSLGDKKLVRAVGTANGKNNIAILVPCHRVIGSDGSLVGYAGELWRKHWLLNHEQSTSGIASQLSLL